MLRIFLRGILFIILVLATCRSRAQVVPEPSDSIQNSDTIAVPVGKEVKVHSPSKATIFSAVLPGLGQAYNRKYWKIPIVYGGFAGLGYVINYYNKYYLLYKQYYYDISDNSSSTNSYINYHPELYNNYASSTNVANAKSDLITSIEYIRKKRDMYIIITAGFYLLNVLDANVDAHFLNFDISEDLSFNFEPVATDLLTNVPIFGGRLTLKF